MVHRSARPGRTAVLMLAGEEGWERTAAGVLGSLSLTWGGAGDIVIPVTADGPDPAFRPAVRAFDPDWISAYRLTSADVQRPDDDEAIWLIDVPDQHVATVAGWCSPFPGRRGRSWCQPGPALAMPATGSTEPQKRKDKTDMARKPDHKFGIGPMVGRPLHWLYLYAEDGSTIIHAFGEQEWADLVKAVNNPQPNDPASEADIALVTRGDIILGKNGHMPQAIMQQRRVEQWHARRAATGQPVRLGRNDRSVQRAREIIACAIVTIVTIVFAVLGAFFVQTASIRSLHGARQSTAL
jgi:hypothetical protein